MVRLLTKVGPDIDRISKLTGTHPETLRYWYKEKIIKSGMVVQAIPNEAALGLRRVAAKVRVPELFVPHIQPVFWAMSDLSYAVAFELAIPDDFYMLVATVPEEFVDLTLARTGGLPLQGVVRLTTRRTRTILVGTESQPLAEVAEDEVGAFFDGDLEAVDHWKELEVELLEGSRGELEKISRELERSGGRRADYPSKFVRAVGSLAGRPLLAEPRPAKGKKDSLARLFVSRWNELVLELIARDQPRGRVHHLSASLHTTARVARRNSHVRRVGQALGLA